MSYIYVNTYQRKNYHTSFKCSDIHCCIGKVFTCYMFKVTHTPTNEHGTSHYMRQIFLRGTYCVQYHLINKAASQHFNQDNVYSNPFKNANVNTCARTPLLPLQKKQKTNTWSHDLPLNGRSCEVLAAGGGRHCAGLLGERGSGGGWHSGCFGVAPSSCDPSGQS